jgi:uroporphyrinogen decarboxylase
MLRALGGKLPDSIPVALGCFPMALPQIPSCDPDEYFKTDVRYVSFEPLRDEEGFLNYLRSLPKHVHIGGISTLRTYWEWGYRPETPNAEPLVEARTLEELKLPSIARISTSFRSRMLSEKVHNYQKKGLAVAGVPPHLGGDIFETAWRLRGFRQFLLDLRRNRELVHYLLDQITAMLVLNSLILVFAGIDILCLDDDLGTPTSMIINPTIWREFIKPRLALTIQLAKQAKPEIIVLYHSDGYIEPIIPELIEIGVNVLNPLQPDVMDPRKLKDEYGNRVAFWGTMGTQILWAWGGPKDIEEEVKLRIETMGKGGRFVISPAYDIDLPGIPLENIIAFVKSARKFGNSR